MARQGSLRQSFALSRSSVQALAWSVVRPLGMLLVLLAGIQPILGIEPVLGGGSGETLDIRVRFEFQSPTAQPWKLRIQIDDDSDFPSGLKDIQNFSEADTTSGMFVLAPDGKSLKLVSRNPIQGGQFEFRLRCTRQAKLRIEAIGEANEQQPSLPTREIPIVDLLGSKLIHSREDGFKDDAMVHWEIGRAATDGLRLEIDSPIPIHQQGTTLGISARANGMIDRASQVHVLTSHLYRLTDDEIIETHRWPLQIDAFGNSPPISLGQLIPSVPGVYELRVLVEPDIDSIWSRLRRRPPPLITKTYSFVVPDTQPQQPPEEQIPWREIGTIRPSESSWSVGQWIPKTTSRLIPLPDRSWANLSGSNLTEKEVSREGNTKDGLPVVDDAPINDLENDSHAGQTVSRLPPGDTFQATLPMNAPGAPHKVTIRLPSHLASPIRVQIGRKSDSATTSFVFENDPTNDLLGPWREHTFVHYPNEDDQIWLTNLDQNKSITFESISVQAGPSHLSSQSEDPRVSQASPRIAAFQLEGIDWVKQWSADRAEALDQNRCTEATLSLYRLWIAADRVQDYAKASGFNSIVIPANHDAFSWYRSDFFQPREDPQNSRLHYLETLLQLLQSSSLKVYVRFKPNMLLTKLEKAIEDRQSNLIELTRTQTTSERAASRLLGSSLLLGADHSDSRTQYNPLHPDVQNELGCLVKELNERCVLYPEFAGVLVECEGDSHLSPTKNADKDAGSLLLYGKISGESETITEIQNRIRQQDTEAFEAWQRTQLHQAYQQVGKNNVVGTLRMLISDSNPMENLDRDVNEVARRSFKREDSAKSDPVEFVGSFRYGPANVLARKASLQKQLISAPATRSAILFGEQRQQASAMRYRVQTMRDLSRLIDCTDSHFLIIESGLCAGCVDTGMNEVIHSYGELPRQPLAESNPIDTASHTVRLRVGQDNQQLYLSMASVVPWDSNVDVEMAEPTEWEILGKPDSKLSPDDDVLTVGTRTRVKVPAGSLVVMRARSQSNTKIRSWSTSVCEGPQVIESIKQKVKLIVERIGILSEFKPYDRLTNGGFEQSGGMGLVGWLHAQHPPGCVRIDEGEFLEGSHSVVLTTKTPSVARTWLVSETIEPPASGRLAVSLACRAQAGNDDSHHRLRISIEATRQGEPVRFSHDLEIARNGQWNEREVILEADEIDTSSIKALRLTIDSLSAGRIWIDDVQLHDDFPTAQERADLQSQAFLAVQGLQRGNLLPVGKLLQNHWSRELLTISVNEQPKSVVETVDKPVESPGVAERIRSWLPRPLRF